MYVYPRKRIRRIIGDRLYFVLPESGPALVELNDDAEKILSLVKEETSSDEIFTRLIDTGVTEKEITDFLEECCNLGVLGSDQTISRHGKEGAVQAKEALADLEDYAADNHLPVCGTMEITTKCNLRCVHCYLGKNLDHSRELTGDEWLGFLPEIVEQGCLWMSITGGDPLLHPDFPQVYRYLTDSGVLVSVLTNGTTLTQEILDLFLENPPDKVEVSIYGYSQAIYELVTGVPGSYVRFRDGIQKMIAAGLNVELKAILMNLNVHEFRAMRDYAASEGAFFRFSGELHEELTGNKAPTEYRLEPQIIAELDFAEPERYAGIIESLSHPVKSSCKLYRCRAGKNGFHVAADGSVQPCLTERQVAFSLAKHSFVEIWEELLPPILDGSYPAEAKCAKCPYLSVCKVCPPRSRMATGSIYQPVPFLCSLAEERSILVKKLEGR